MGTSRILKVFIYFVIKFVIVASVLLGGVMGFSYYKEYPVRSFCNDLPPTATPEIVMSMASDKNLPVFNAIESRGVIIVLNQKSPFFRFSCEVEFDGNQQIGKNVSAAD